MYLHPPSHVTIRDTCDRSPSQLVMRASLLAPTALLALCTGAHGRVASELTPLKQTAPSLLALRGGGPGVEVSAKTFLPQKSFGFGLWKNGMRVHLNNESTF